MVFEKCVEKFLIQYEGYITIQITCKMSLISHEQFSQYWEKIRWIMYFILDAQMEKLHIQFGTCVHWKITYLMQLHKYEIWIKTNKTYNSTILLNLWPIQIYHSVEYGVTTLFISSHLNQRCWSFIPPVNTLFNKILFEFQLICSTSEYLNIRLEGMKVLLSTALLF